MTLAIELELKAWFKAKLALAALGEKQTQIPERTQSDIDEWHMALGRVAICSNDLFARVKKDNEWEEHAR
jgi:hypothetical protein